MANYSEIAEEINKTHGPNSMDIVRAKYIKKFSVHRNRNTITYYSAFLQKSSNLLGIDDNDKNGFMSAVYKLDRSKGLDLIIHTPGGNIAATESIIEYLHSMFNGDIVVFVPQIAMSAGTMIACCCKEIYLGKQSSLGPIDPQLGGISAEGVLEEYKKAVEEIRTKPSSAPIWQVIFSKYSPAFLGDCEKAVKRGKEIVKKYMKLSMFPDKTDTEINRVVDHLSSHEISKNHSKHIGINECKEIGLKIKDLEEDQVLQDLLLSVHHCYMNTITNSNALKLIENQNKGRFITAMQPK